MHKRFLRRRFMVDWKLQGGLCAHALLYGTLMLAIVCGGIFVPLLWQLSDAPNQAHGLEDQAIVMIYMHERFWLMALACFVLLALGSVRLSHRIAGPMVRYKRNLRFVADGKLPPPLRTRSADYLKEEVACLNLAVDGVRSRVGAIRASHAALRRELLALVESRPARADGLEALVEAQRALERSIEAFQELGDLDTLPEPEPVGGVVLAFAGRQAQGD